MLKKKKYIENFKYIIYMLDELLIDGTYWSLIMTRFFFKQTQMVDMKFLKDIMVQKPNMKYMYACSRLEKVLLYIANYIVDTPLEKREKQTNKMISEKEWMIQPEKKNVLVLKSIRYEPDGKKIVLTRTIFCDGTNMYIDPSQLLKKNEGFVDLYELLEYYNMSLHDINMDFLNFCEKIECEIYQKYNEKSQMRNSKLHNYEEILIPKYTNHIVKPAGIYNETTKNDTNEDDFAYIHNLITDFTVKLHMQINIEDNLVNLLEFKIKTDQSVKFETLTRGLYLFLPIFLVKSIFGGIREKKIILPLVDERDIKALTDILIGRIPHKLDDKHTISIENVIRAMASICYIYPSEYYPFDTHIDEVYKNFVGKLTHLHIQNFLTGVFFFTQNMKLVDNQSSDYMNRGGEISEINLSTFSGNIKDIVLNKLYLETLYNFLYSFRTSKMIYLSRKNYLLFKPESSIFFIDCITQYIKYTILNSKRGKNNRVIVYIMDNLVTETYNKIVFSNNSITKEKIFLSINESDGQMNIINSNNINKNVISLNWGRELYNETVLNHGMYYNFLDIYSHICTELDMLSYIKDKNSDTILAAADFMGILVSYILETSFNFLTRLQLSINNDSNELLNELIRIGLTGVSLSLEKDFEEMSENLHSDCLRLSNKDHILDKFINIKNNDPKDTTTPRIKKIYIKVLDKKLNYDGIYYIEYYSYNDQKFIHYHYTSNNELSNIPNIWKILLHTTSVYSYFDTSFHTHSSKTTKHKISSLHTAESFDGGFMSNLSPIINYCSNIGDNFIRKKIDAHSISHSIMFDKNNIFFNRNLHYFRSFNLSVSMPSYPSK
ncbi:hypothetical protein EON71_00745 [bacterium]|nr:MAG: hypothetical protein EON71_00745 [bacterium]